MNFKLSRINRFILAAATTICTFAVRAETAPVFDGVWHGSINIGGAATSGNATSVALSAATDTVRATAQDKVTLYGLGNYGSSNASGAKTITADSLRVGGRYDYNLTESAFAFGTTEGEANKIAGLHSRLSLGVGAGYKVIDTKDNTFDVFAGVGDANVKYTTGNSTNSVVLILGEESTHHLSTSTTLKQRLVVEPGKSTIGTLTTFDASISTTLVGAWTLNTGLSMLHSSVVPSGHKSTDGLLTFGFGYKY